jgi:hypothetical protein
MQQYICEDIYKNGQLNYKKNQKLYETNLNFRNLFKSINEHEIFAINYHIGILKLEPSEYVKIDNKTRKIFMDYKIYL